MTKDMKKDDARINVEDMAKVDGGLNDYSEKSLCPKCGTSCNSVSANLVQNEITAEYVCPNCGHKFSTTRKYPYANQIPFGPIM